MKLEFSRQIFEKPQISNFMDIHPMGAEFFHANGNTDRNDETNSRSSHFCGRA
jgi:hypothetical protein